jgi:NitT/TauT family transport system substrate-binding protein
MLLGSIGLASQGALHAAANPAEFNVCWSHYTGWEPWAYADSSGVLKKWADKFGIKIKLTLINDYVESINLYTAGKYDACTMTNMDALTIPAAGGIDSTALIIGDFSNGNDGIVAKGIGDLKEIKGKSVKLVELSVSHYLLARGLESVGLKESDIKVINTSDADIGGVFTAEKDGVAVTWNPILQQLKSAQGVKLLYDSSKIPGEIIDLMVVKTAAPDTLKKALVGAWYEVMATMSGTGTETDKATAAMAKTAGGTVDDFKSQLKTTAMFYKPADAVNFAKSADLKKTMEYVRTFSFERGLFGKGAKSKDDLGISFHDGTVFGSKNNVKLRFDPSFMEQAVSGKL